MSFLPVVKWRLLWRPDGKPVVTVRWPYAAREIELDREQIRRLMDECAQHLLAFDDPPRL